VATFILTLANISHSLVVLLRELPTIASVGSSNQSLILTINFSLHRIRTMVKKEI
jgi:hypothetical protein